MKSYHFADTPMARLRRLAQKIGVLSVLSIALIGNAYGFPNGGGLAGGGGNPPRVVTKMPYLKSQPVPRSVPACWLAAACCCFPTESGK